MSEGKPLPRCWEDFETGQVFVTPGVTITESMIIDFALLYDPQSMHIDVEAARHGPYGGLISSGFLTMALSFRMVLAAGFLAPSCIGSPGMDEVRWLKPVRPGDTLHVEAEVQEVRASTSRADRGSARIKYTSFNQRGEPVMTMTAIELLRRRSD